MLLENLQGINITVSVSVSVPIPYRLAARRYTPNRNRQPTTIACAATECPRPRVL